MPRELYHWDIHLNGDLWGETERESIFWPHFLLISQETWKVSIVERLFLRVTLLVRAVNRLSSVSSSDFSCSQLKVISSGTGCNCKEGLIIVLEQLTQFPVECFVSTSQPGSE